MTGVAQLEVAAIAPARRFLMLDQPQAFAGAPTTLLATQVVR